MILPDLFFLLVRSIGAAALDVTIGPGMLQPWVDELESYVSKLGKFTKFSVSYLPFSPPPVFWDYKCKKCLWWVDPNTCKTVEGNISPNGWCAIWVPPSTYKPFTWPVELIKGEW